MYSSILSYLWNAVKSCLWYPNCQIYKYITDILPEIVVFKLIAVADNKYNGKFVFHMVEDIVRKVENAGYQYLTYYHTTKFQTCPN